MSIEQISALGIADRAEFVSQEPIKPSVQNQEVSFSSVLQGGVNQVNDSLNSANVMLEKLALNQPVSTHEVMITMEKAKLQLQMSIEIRNKLVEGYQEIMRMQL